MVADMEVDLVANMEVDKVADMAYDITPACHISGRHGGQEDKWPTLRWTWWPTWRLKKIQHGIGHVARHGGKQKK